MWSELTWFMWSDFIFQWSEVKLRCLGTKVPCALVWPYTDDTWLYCDYFIWCVSCTVVVLTCFVMCGRVYVGGFVMCGCGFCNVWVCVCRGFCNVWVCVCVGFAVCGCVYVGGFVMCGCVYVGGFVMCRCVYVWVLQCVGVCTRFVQIVSGLEL